MDVTVIRPHQLRPDQLRLWRTMQEESPYLDNPFLAPDFAIAVGCVRQDARVAVLRDGTRTVGFFPYQEETSGVAKPLAAGLSDCQALVHGPGVDWDARTLLEGCNLKVWEFDHLLAHQRPFVPFHRFHAPSPVMDLSAGYEAYLKERKSVSKSLIPTVLRKERKLAREVGDVHLEWDSASPEALGQLLRWKSEQYRRTGMPNRLSRRWVKNLVDELGKARSGGFGRCVSALYAGPHLVAVHLGIRTKRVLSWWFPAYDSSFGQYSPGSILLLKMAQSAAADGIAHIDLGKGRHDYKERFKSWELPVVEGWVERPSLTAAVRRLRRLPHRFVLSYVVNGPLEDSVRSVLRRGGQLRAGFR